MYLQTTNMVSVRKLHDVAEIGYLCLSFLLVVICIFLKSNRISRWLHRLAARVYLIEFKMDSLSLPFCNEMTGQLLTFLLCGFLYTQVLHF